MLRHTQAGDIGAPSAENADFIVIQTHLSLGLAAALPNWPDLHPSAVNCTLCLPPYGGTVGQ